MVGWEGGCNGMGGGWTGWEGEQSRAEEMGVQSRAEQQINDEGLLTTDSQPRYLSVQGLGSGVHVHGRGGGIKRGLRNSFGDCKQSPSQKGIKGTICIALSRHVFSTTH